MGTGGFNLKVQTPTDDVKANQAAAPVAGDFSDLGSVRSVSLESTAQEIDITTQSSNENREILDERGTKSWNVSVSGVVSSADLFKSLELNVLNNKLRWFRLVQSDNANRTYLAKFKISNISIEGANDSEVTFSMSLMSSGPRTIT